MKSILHGIKVLDLTRIIAGPLSTQTLADMGATVYKIEKPGEGDDSRRMGPFMRDGGVTAEINPVASQESATFMAYNRGKHSVTVDIATEEGATLIRQLAMHCDIVIENYKAGGLKKYGLDYDSLCKVKPDLIYCSITGFGQTGPYAARPAYDFILQGMAGPMSTCGQPDGVPGATPMRTSIPMTDITTGLYATIAMLGALYHRRETGEGQYIDTSLLDAAVSFNGHLAVGYLMTGKSPTRAGNTNPIAAPADVYPCKDGYLIIAAGNNSQFKSLCQAIGVPQLADDPSFATNSMRIANRGLMQDILLPNILKFTKAELLQKFEAAGVPSGPINNMEEVFADPQTKHRNIQIEVPHSSGVDVKLVRNPLLFSRTPIQHKAPPILGEHTDRVMMEELGLTREQIEGLRARNIV